MTGALLSRAKHWRVEELACGRDIAVALLYGSLLAALFICASAGRAHASTNASTEAARRGETPKAHFTSLLATTQRSAVQGFLRGFPEPSVPTIVNRRLDIQALEDIDISIPVLRPDRAPVKSMLAAKPLRLAATAPATAAPRPGQNGGAAPAAMVGVASTYDPINPDASDDSGGLETASGELYDEEGWTAAIRTDLRDRFGGVHYGKNYQAAYALVEAGDKRLIVRINDVGPLMPGRIIDLNQRAMRYFDPSLELGLINDVRVTPLPGPYWTAGPLDGDGEMMLLAAATNP